MDVGRAGRRRDRRITVEKVMVRVGLADPSDRDADDVDAHRRLLRVARAVHRVRMQRAEDITSYEGSPDRWAAR